MLLQGDAVFGELTENITAVIRYFNAQVEQARGFGGWDWSVENVLDVIKGGPHPALALVFAKFQEHEHMEAHVQQAPQTRATAASQRW